MRVGRQGRYGKVRHWLLAVLAALALVVALGPRNTFGPETPTPRAAVPADPARLDAWLLQQESAWPDIRPGLAKQISWHGRVGEPTPWAVVYVHGFTASRLETAPLAARVAQRLGANLFETRLAGHGRTPEAMGEPQVQDWLADVVEAVQVGQRLGQRVLLIGVSTGGTLATWVGQQALGRSVAGYVLVSPNFGPRDKTSELINAPWGKSLALWLEGPQRGEVSGDPREALAWTERYDTRALFPMMALVRQVRQAELARFVAPVLVLYAEGDQTVDPAQTRAVFEHLGSPHKVLQLVDDSEAVGQHVLAGDIRAPRSTEPMAARIGAWAAALPTTP